jgi:hypothetical protein
MDELAAMISVYGGKVSQAPFFAAGALPGRSLLIVARSPTGAPLGCGAFYPMSQYVAELIGPYSRSGAAAVRGEVVARLEAAATRFGFVTMRVGASRSDRRLVAFYEAHGFSPVPAYGRYVGITGASCLEKRLCEHAGDSRRPTP